MTQGSTHIAAAPPITLTGSKALRCAAISPTGKAAMIGGSAGSRIGIAR